MRETWGKRLVHVARWSWRVRSLARDSKAQGGKGIRIARSGDIGRLLRGGCW
jgi:hypothetical protein